MDELLEICLHVEDINQCAMADMNRVSENEGVTIRLTSQLDEDGEYDAFTSISVDVNVNNQHAGTISGTIINRRRIPERMFLSAMDGHSGELQYIGVSLFEPRLGRTKLQSLVEGGDDVGFEFLYIDKMHLDDHFKRNGNSDVGAHAIRQLLQHASLQNVSLCIYILDPYEGMSSMSRADKDRLEVDEQRNKGSRMPLGMICLLEDIMIHRQRRKDHCALRRRKIN